MVATGSKARETWGTHQQPRTHRSWTPLGRALTATGDHWTLLIVLQLAMQRMRLSELHRCLPGISTGVLERYVQQMETLRLLTRTRYREMPPRVELELTDTGRELLPIAVALTRWGMLHMWSAPNKQEQVGIELFLRVLPLLVEGALKVDDGVVQAIVNRRGEPPACVGYRIRKGRLLIDDVAEDVDSRVEGSTKAWVDALSPTAAHERLTFAGDSRLAIGILEALPRRIGP
jgi:DNA-binding HxlR family transcriptional regulator